MKRRAICWRRRATFRAAELFCDYTEEWVRTFVLLLSYQQKERVGICTCYRKNTVVGLPHKSINSLLIIAVLFSFTDFIRTFLKHLGEIEKDAKTGQCCLEAYNSTLANFHPWIIRKGVAVSVFALPTRDVLLTRVCSNVQEAIDRLPKSLEVMSVVYDRTQELYTKYDLHGLP